MPFLQGNLLLICGNPVPEILDVVDLFLDGKVVESRWRHGKSLGHGRQYNPGSKASVPADYPARKRSLQSLGDRTDLGLGRRLRDAARIARVLEFDHPAGVFERQCACLV